MFAFQVILLVHSICLCMSLLIMGNARDLAWQEQVSTTGPGAN